MALCVSRKSPKLPDVRGHSPRRILPSVGTRRSISRTVAAVVGLIALLFFLAGLAKGETGKVVAVSDGDTLTVLTADKKQLKICMAGIDAPKSKQHFGKRAKENLSQLVYGKTVTLEGAKTDKYGW